MEEPISKKEEPISKNEIEITEKLKYIIGNQAVYITQLEVEKQSLLRQIAELLKPPNNKNC